jgi:hypothetical protein
MAALEEFLAERRLLLVWTTASTWSSRSRCSLVLGWATISTTAPVRGSILATAVTLFLSRP